MAIDVRYRSMIKIMRVAVLIFGMLLVLTGCGSKVVGTVDENKDIVLTGLPDGSYTLYYENEDGILADYHGISVTGLKYTGLIRENVAPAEATKIGLYNADGQRVGTIELGSLAAPDLGSKLYSQASISDIHLQQETAADDFKKALTYFNSLEDLLLVNVCGDLTDVGSAEELAYYAKMRDDYSLKPVYAVSGNHEYLSCTTFDSSIWTQYTGHNLWYSYTQGDDVYIMVGANGSARPFSASELQWLYETLEANRNKRCFVYQHLFAWDGSGDAAGLNGHGDLLDNTPGQVFLSLMSHYKNVVWFHGHSHQLFRTQEQFAVNNVDSAHGRYNLHIPSLAAPREVVDGKAQYASFKESEGYIVDVYENGIVLRGRDFVNDKFLPLATFYLDTTIQIIDEGSYYDPTGTIINNNLPALNALPDGSTVMINQRYSESQKGIIDANGYASVVIPCVGDGATPYTLQFSNTGLDLSAPKKSRYFLLDSEKNILGWVNGSAFFSEMSGVTQLSEDTIEMKFIPSAGTAYIVVCIEEKSDTAISGLNLHDYEISLKKDVVGFDLPEGTTWMLNQRYSESNGGIIDAKGYASFLIPCVGDGTASYVLQMRNTGLNLAEARTSRCFLLDAEKNLLGRINDSAFFSEMSGVTVLEDGTIQLSFTPAGNTAYIILCIAEKNDALISALDIDDYSILLAPVE